MTNISLAIQKAVEGGWDSEECQVPIGARGRFNYDRAWLDPTFWQALGKTEGWAETMFPLTFSHREDGLNEETLYWKGENGHQYVPHLAGKKYYQHRLIDAIQQGRSIDEFFGEILKLKSFSSPQTNRPEKRKVKNNTITKRWKRT